MALSHHLAHHHGVLQHRVGAHLLTGCVSLGHGRCVPLRRVRVLGLLVKERLVATLNRGDQMGSEEAALHQCPCATRFPLLVLVLVLISCRRLWSLWQCSRKLPVLLTAYYCRCGAPSLRSFGRFRGRRRQARGQRHGIRIVARAQPEGHSLWRRRRVYAAAVIQLRLRMMLCSSRRCCIQRGQGCLRCWRRSRSSLHCSPSRLWRLVVDYRKSGRRCGLRRGSPRHFIVRGLKSVGCGGVVGLVRLVRLLQYSP